jgi:hypothetical protein
MVHVLGIAFGAQLYPIGPPVESAAWRDDPEVVELLAYRQTLRRLVPDPALKFACEEPGPDGLIVREKQLGHHVVTVLEVEVAGRMPHAFLPDSAWPPEELESSWAAFIHRHLRPYSSGQKNAIVVVEAAHAEALARRLTGSGLVASATILHDAGPA